MSMPIPDFITAKTKFGPILVRLEVEYIEKYSIQYRLLSNLMNTIQY